MIWSQMSSLKHTVFYAFPYLDISYFLFSVEHRQVRTNGQICSDSGLGEPSRGHWVACDHKCGLSYTCRCSNLFMYNARRSVLARSHDFGCSVYIRSSTFIFIPYCYFIALCMYPATCREAVWSPCGRCVGAVCAVGTVWKW